jgi:hypothetical protein
MVPDPGRRLPGSGWAARIRPFDSPVLRVRYRGGVVINLAGLPEWDLLARAMVALPAPEPDHTVDELRVVDVLTANEVMLAAGDPLWSFTAADYAALTPPGWTWVHVFGDRRIVLVPAEVHGAFRHLGGVATMPVDRSRRGVAIENPGSVPLSRSGTLDDPLMDAIEQRIGYPLPPAYRRFLAEGNGAVPTTPGIHPGHGFVVDQPFFSIGASDRHQDLLYARPWFADRLTDEYLAISYVQGGVLALRLTGPDAGSVWFADADDPRDDDRYDAAEFCARVLSPCAADLDAFWAELSVVPGTLLAQVDARIAAGEARQIVHPELGLSLPPAKRPPLA